MSTFHTSFLIMHLEDLALHHSSSRAVSCSAEIRSSPLTEGAVLPNFYNKGHNRGPVTSCSDAPAFSLQIRLSIASLSVRDCESPRPLILS